MRKLSASRDVMIPFSSPSTAANSSPEEKMPTDDVEFVGERQNVPPTKQILQNRYNNIIENEIRIQLDSNSTDYNVPTSRKTQNYTRTKCSLDLSRTKKVFVDTTKFETSYIQAILPTDNTARFLNVKLIDGQSAKKLEQWILCLIQRAVIRTNIVKAHDCTRVHVRTSTYPCLYCVGSNDSSVDLF